MPAIGRAIQLLKLPFVKVGTAYNNVAVKAPMLTGVVTTVVKTSAADLFAQKASRLPACTCGRGSRLLRRCCLRAEFYLKVGMHFLTRLLLTLALGVQVVEGRDEVDWRRHGMFVMFGFGYLVCSTHEWRLRSQGLGGGRLCRGGKGGACHPHAPTTPSRTPCCMFVTSSLYLFWR